MSETHSLTIETNSIEETLAAGSRFGKCLAPSTVVSLIGTLGSGKTHFVKGVAQGNETPAEIAVNSPTFVIVNEYPGNLYLYHIDAYRLERWEDLEAIGFDEMADGGGAVFVEWADRVPECIPPDHVEVKIEITGETKRRFELIGYGPKATAIIKAMGNG